MCNFSYMRVSSDSTKLQPRGECRESSGGSLVLLIFCAGNRVSRSLHVEASEVAANNRA